MRLRNDERGVVVQVGVAILIAFLLVALTLYQVNVVPQQNQATEYQHSQAVHEKLQQVRNAIVSVPGSGGGQSVSIPLGTSYRPRTFALNPPDPAGRLATTSAGRLSIDNAVATGSPEVKQFWNGSRHAVWTRGLSYRPDYNEYRSAPTVFYENTVLFDRHENATVTRTDQVLIEGNTITLVALNGTYSKASQRTVSVDLRAASASSRTVAVSNETGENVTITIPSRLPVEKWRKELLADETAVASVAPARGGDAVRITLVQGTYRLRMAKVGIGSNVTSETSAYVTDVRGDGSSVQAGGRQTLTVEVRDQFNNPVAGRTVEANVTAGGGNVVGSGTATTGADGRASFTYNASSASGTAQIAVNLTRRDPPRNYEQVTFTVYVDSGGNDGGNQAPNADAGGDRTAGEGDRVTLDGTGSSDPDGDSLDYDWTQTGGPSVTLRNSTTPTPDFDAPSVNTETTLRFELTVTDPDGVSDSDSVSVVVQDTDNQPPTADPNGPYSVGTGNSVELDGTGSSDPDDSVASYSWQIVGDDYGATLSGADTATPTFEAPDSVSGRRTVTVELTVTDRDGATDTATTDVTIEPSDTRPPTIVSATLPDREINYTEAGNNLRQNLTVEFDEDMDQSVPPSIAFENIVDSGNLTVVEESWTGARTYEWRIEYQQNGVDTDVTVNVSDAQDLAGNRMAEETALTFTFDANPPGDVQSTRYLTDPINLSNQGSVETEIRMPSTLSGDETVVVTVTGPNGGTLTRREPVSVAGGQYQTVGGFDVSGFADGTMGPVEAYLVDDVNNTGGVTANTNDPLKETTVPRVTDVTVEDAPITDPDTGVTKTVTITFNESMDQSTDPTVTITGLSRTYTVTPENGGFQDDTTWTGQVTFQDDDEEANGTVEIAGARDLGYNEMATNTSATVGVDTQGPTVESFDVSNPSNAKVDISVTTDESIGTISVSLSRASGSQTLTFTQEDFDETCSGGTCTYTLISPPSVNYGRYDGTLTAIVDEKGNTGTAGQTDIVYVGPNRIVDDFEQNPDLGTNPNWSVNTAGSMAVSLDDDRTTANSPTHAVRVGEVNDNGGIESRLLDTRGFSKVSVSLSVKQGDPDGDTPNPGEDLLIQYRDPNGNWVTGYRAEATSDLDPYRRIDLSLRSADAFHDGFAVRVVQEGTSYTDDWFVDDICVFPGGGSCPLGDSSEVSGSDLVAWDVNDAEGYDHDGIYDGLEFTLTNDLEKKKIDVTAVTIDTDVGGIGQIEEASLSPENGARWASEIWVEADKNGFIEASSPSFIDMGERRTFANNNQPRIKSGSTGTFYIYELEQELGGAIADLEVGDTFTVTVEYEVNGRTKTVTFVRSVQDRRSE